MAAVFVFSESNTISEVVTDNIANLNFGSNDSKEIVTSSYPVIAGESSFEKYLRAKFTSTYTEISNMKFWKSAGALVTGEVIKAAANVSFVTPSATANADSAIPTSLGAALSIQSMEGNATIVYGASGVSGYSKYIRLQADTTIASPAGAANQKTFTFQYDEV